VSPRRPARVPAPAGAPVAAPPPLYWETRTDGSHTHRWQHGPWQWELATADNELGVDDLARVIASIPGDE